MYNSFSEIYSEVGFHMVDTSHRWHYRSDHQWVTNYKVKPLATCIWILSLQATIFNITIC